MAFNERKAEGSDGFVFTNVADSRHQWANDNLGVVLEEVNLCTCVCVCVYKGGL